MNKEISCGIIPVFVHPETQELEFLLIQHHAGHWGFPKGHKHLDETYLETAIRELQEETNLVCDHIDPDCHLAESYFVKRPERGVISKTAHYFIGYVPHQDVQIQEEELQNYMWGTEQQTLEKITHRESRELFQRALRYLNS